MMQHVLYLAEPNSCQSVQLATYYYSWTRGIYVQENNGLLWYANFDAYSSSGCCRIDYWMTARLRLHGWKNNYFFALCRCAEGIWRQFNTYSLSVPSPVRSGDLLHFRVVARTCIRLSGRRQLNWNPGFHKQWVSGKNWLGHSLTILILWCIWKQRNMVIFKDNRKMDVALFLEIKDNVTSAGGEVLVKPLTIA